MSIDRLHSPDRDAAGADRVPLPERAARTDAERMHDLDPGAPPDRFPARDGTGTNPDSPDVNASGHHGPSDTTARSEAPEADAEPTAANTSADPSAASGADELADTDTAPADMSTTGSDESPETAQRAAGRDHILAGAAERAEQQVDAACAEFGVDTPEGRSAVATARAVIADTLAPFTVEASTRILAALRAQVAERPDAVVAILERDGTGIGMAIEELDPDFFAAHCRTISLSRRATEHMLQDQEDSSGKEFPELENDFRDRAKADPEEVPGATQRITRHLVSQGLPVDRPGAHIIVVDSGHRGTIQEHLAAMFPKQTFSGHYLFHMQAEQDPHPGSKTGHVLHRTPEQSIPADPDDPAAIYADKDPAVVFEHLLHGIMSSTQRFDERGSPIREPEYPSTDQLNPLAVAPEYADPNVRIATMAIAQLAVADCARTTAELSRIGIDPGRALTEQARACTDRVRSWAYDPNTGDPAFNALADSFVRRDDKDLVPRFRSLLADLDIGGAAATAAWHGYQQLSLADKTRYVTHLENSIASPNPPLPEGMSNG